MSRMIGGGPAAPSDSLNILDGTGRYGDRNRQVKYSRNAIQSKLVPFKDGAVWGRSRGLGGSLGAGLDSDGGTTGRYGLHKFNSLGVRSGLKYIGVTKNSSGTPVGGYTVSVFLTSLPGVVVSQCVSDNGGYFEAISIYPSVAHYLVAYKGGAPDTAGTSKNNLVFT